MYFNVDTCLDVSLGLGEGFCFGVGLGVGVEAVIKY